MAAPLPPKVTLPDDLLEELTGARDVFDIRWEWIERGDPRCYGRDFGFWDIRAGPHGWRDQKIVYDRAVAAGAGIGGTPVPEVAVVIVQGADFAETLKRVLEMAWQKWG